MIKNYLKIAWRNLVKNPVYSFLNIAGLAIGLSCFILIALYVSDELSFDKFYTNASRIYRINGDLKFGGSELKLPVVSDPMGAVMKADYPEVEEYCRLYADGNKQIKKGNEFINEFNVIHADSTFFSVFDLPAIAGNTKTSLNEPNTVVITASTAKKYFGTTDAIGKTIETTDNKKTIYKVTAVISDIPSNSHFHFDFIFSMKNVDYQWGNFLSNNLYTYLLLREGTDYKKFEENFATVVKKYVMPQAKLYMQVGSMEEFERAGNKLNYWLIPMTKIHLHSDRSFELSAGGNIQYVYIFSAVALFLLLIACINFMNLTTARSARRAREVGIRKVLGTLRKNLMSQFLAESILISFISLLMAIGISYACLPLFNSISAKTMSLGNLLGSGLLPYVILLPFVVGIIAGSYPAFYLSSFRPIEVLKGKLSSGSSRSILRSGLVVFQFTISIIIIISTVVIYKQLNYISHKNLGFNKDQVLIINDAYALNDRIDVFKNEMLEQNGVLSGTITGFLPVDNASRNDYTFSKEAVMDSKSGLDMQIWRIDEDYMKTMGMELAAGRNFSRQLPTDSSSIIINEETQKLLGYANPVGQNLYSLGMEAGAPPQVYRIIGVVKNFHFATMRENIGPLAFMLGRHNGLVSFKVSGANVSSIIKAAESKWKTIAPGKPFSYRFLDDSFNDMYRAEQRVGKISVIFAVLAIFIACLGLFGLSTFITEQRTKEIGIRKVLGASVNRILSLVSRDFLKLVVIAFIIAAPVAWMIMHKWLEDFAYRVNIGWWIFSIAGFLALFIAMLTLSFQALKAAMSNPVKNLRTE